MLYKKLVEDHLSDKIILYCNSVHYSYKQLNDKALALGSKWTAEGLCRGDRVVVECRDRTDTVTALLACIAYGFVFVPIEPDHDRREYIIEDCRPKLIYSGLAAPERTPIEREMLPPDTVGYIIYTSGSTSAPKGVVAPFSSIIFCINAINERLGNSGEDRIVCVLPLSFDYGLYQVFLSLSFGAELILAEENTTMLSLPKLCAEMEATALPVVPTMLSALLRLRMLKQEYFGGLRYISSTGEALEVDLIKKVHEALPNVQIIPMYGLTECKRVAVMPQGRWDKILAGSCGLPLDGIEVNILGCADGEGELTVRGPNVMNGYFGFVGEDDGTFCTDSGGGRYLRTGDCFSIDSEGFLYFQYRIKNIIKVGGYAVSAAEMEEKLRGLEGVLDTRVFGIPNDAYGELICACIYTKSTDLEERVRMLSERLPPHKQIKKLKIISEPFPTNINGKVDIKALKDYFK